MAFSSAVNPGDTILASQYNNVRKDIFDTTGGHNHDGSNSKRLSSTILSISAFSFSIKPSNANMSYTNSITAGGTIYRGPQIYFIGAGISLHNAYSSIEIPKNSIATNIKMWYRRLDAAVQLDCILYKTQKSIANPNIQIAVGTLVGTSVTGLLTSASLVINEPIDIDTYFYYFYLLFSDNGTLGRNSFYGIELAYTP